MNSTAKTILFWIAILLTAVLLYQLVQRSSTGNVQTLPFNRFLQEVQNGNVTQVKIADQDVTGKFATGGEFKTYIPAEYPPLIDILQERKVEIIGEPKSQSPWLAALVSWAPFLFLIGFWI
ncbi:MAG: ATP-dependent metallopeptidase FtsH/Yme1/Tma family protein, partial [Acidobacteria bacterium]|nr:ATP-dependent metallopeptidase FtsH/Yme1/Tma family protein [Acidobacteriota bacterium]